MQDGVKDKLVFVVVVECGSLERAVPHTEGQGWMEELGSMKNILPFKRFYINE